MAVNSQNLLVMIIMINMMIHLNTSMYYSPTTIDQEYLDNEDTIFKEIADNIKDEEALPGSNTNLAFENSYGNPISIGGEIFKAFGKGILPLPVTTSMVQTQTEKNMMNGLNIVKYILWLLGAFELYLILKNKKAS